MHKVSRRLATWIEAHTHDRHDQDTMIAIYTFGIEVILSFAITLMSVLLVSMITKQFECTGAFLFSFVLLRLFCDGYHAKKYWQCLVITNILHGIVLLFANQSSPVINQSILEVCIIIVSIIIINLTPVKSAQKKITGEQSKRLRALTSVILAIIIMNTCLMYPVGSKRLGIATLISLTEVLILMIYPKLLNKPNNI